MPYKLNTDHRDTPWSLVLISVACAVAVIAFFLYFVDGLSKIGGAL